VLPASAPVTSGSKRSRRVVQPASIGKRQKNGCGLRTAGLGIWWSRDRFAASGQWAARFAGFLAARPPSGAIAPGSRRRTGRSASENGVSPEAGLPKASTLGTRRRPHRRAVAAEAGGVRPPCRRRWGAESCPLPHPATEWLQAVQSALIVKERKSFGPIYSELVRIGPTNRTNRTDAQARGGGTTMARKRQESSVLHLGRKPRHDDNC
jgi:hypothetical protein